MIDSQPDRRARAMIRIAQLLLVVSAGSLWAASRLPWVVIRSFDGLGQPKTATLPGASWSTALLPLALLLLAAAVALLAVRGLMLRLLAVLLALVSLAAGYLAISLWAIRDVAVRGVDLAHVSVAALLGSERHYWGAVITLAAAVCALLSAVLLLRRASVVGRCDTTKYAVGATRNVEDSRGGDDAVMSERMIWDALDEGHDPTDRPPA